MAGNVFVGLRKTVPDKMFYFAYREAIVRKSVPLQKKEQPSDKTGLSLTIIHFKQLLDSKVEICQN